MDGSSPYSYGEKQHNVQVDESEISCKETYGLWDNTNNNIFSRGYYEEDITKTNTIYIYIYKLRYRICMDM